MTDKERKIYDAGWTDAETRLAYKGYVPIDDVLAIIDGVRDYYAETIQITTAAEAVDRCRAAVEKLKP